MAGDEMTTRDLITLVTEAQAKVFDSRVAALDDRLRDGLSQIALRLDRDADDRRRERNEDRARSTDLEAQIDHLSDRFDARLRPLERLADKITGSWGVVVIVSAVAGLLVSLLSLIKSLT